MGLSKELLDAIREAVAKLRELGEEAIAGRLEQESGGGEPPPKGGGGGG